MRHKVKGRKLGRTSSHRKATMQALASALIHERRIQTTLAKAKELRSFVEPLITRAKEDSSHNRRQVFSKLQDKYTVSELFEEVGPAAKDRPGGYTRVVRIGFRSGDASEMAMIELVDYNDVKPEQRQEGKRRTRRSGRSKSEDQQAAQASQQQSAVVESTESDQAHSGDPAETPAEKSSDKQSLESTADSPADSADFKVDEVKEKIVSMGREELESFTSGDERVTVQRAVEKRLEEIDKEKSEE